MAVTTTRPPRQAAHQLPDEPVVANDAEGRLGFRDLRDVWASRELLYFLTWRDIKVRYKQTAMGALWAVVQPLGMMLVLAVVFSLIGGPTDGMPFFIFFYCGLLPWTFFSGAVSVGSLSLVTNSNLISKVYFPRVLLPTATVGAGLVDMAIASVILVILAFYYRMPATWNLLMLPVLVLLTVLLTLGVVLWLSALTVKYRDVRHVIPFALQIGFFATPIIYPTSLVAEKWRWLLFFNPMTGVVEGVRSALSGRPFDWAAIGFSAAVTLVLLVLSVAAFHRTEKSFADLI